MKLTDLLEPDDATVAFMEAFYQAEYAAADRVAVDEMSFRDGFRAGWKAALKLVRNADRD